MSKAHKISVIILFSASIIFFIITTGVLAIKEKEKGRRIKLAGELSQTQGELTQTKTELETTVKAKEDLSQKLDEETAKANQLAQALAAEKEQTGQLTKKVADCEADIDDLEAQIKDKDTKLESLSKEKDGLVTELTALKEEKAKLEEEKAKLQEKADKYPDPNAVDLGKISVVALQGLEGSVMAVNKEFNFIIINVGTKDKVVKGVVLLVYRGDNLVAKVEVDRVYDDMCSANVLSDWKQKDVKVGDKVKAL